MMRYFRIIFCAVLMAGLVSFYARQAFPSGIVAGMTREELLGVYPEPDKLTYRTEPNKEWITFNNKEDSSPGEIITFRLVDGKVEGWDLDDRHEFIREYVGEFASGYYRNANSLTGKAILNVLTSLPWKDVLVLTNRKRPVVFVENHSDGPGRIANSTDMRSFKGDPPTCTEGLWIVKLSTELEGADSVDEIESIVAHEMAHYLLDNGMRVSADPASTEKYEREAADLVEKWGFADEMKKARARFGGSRRAVVSTTGGNQ
ncbi:MAG: hypothetical protein HQL30_00010 [Candidatus Omnitrophica bacterium]|nr:hypothetical protein [Candidatus Omnitrophota bacterium]